MKFKSLNTAKKSKRAVSVIIQLLKILGVCITHAIFFLPAIDLYFSMFVSFFLDLVRKCTLK